MKIWRYMDLSKFISLLSNEALFFSYPNEFNDPYEFHLPTSHEEAITEKILEPKRIELQELIQEMKKNKPEIELDKEFKKLENQSFLTYRELENESKKRFGVSCWHINDYENEALWKIYTNIGQGIAIETTDEKLNQSLTYHKKITCDKVRYEDFDIAPIEKGHKHYGGFIKRKAFDYEKEYRAMVLLDEENWGNGCLIKTNLNVLIDKIHISPLMPKYFLESVKYLCRDKFEYLHDRIHMSNLYDRLIDK